MNCLAQLQEKLHEPLLAVDNLIQEKLKSDVPLVNELGHHVLTNKGKRLRPLLLLLTAQASGPLNEAAITLATVLEFIHIATLLHDDVIDNSALRRAQPTANSIYGNSASVLVGDYLYSRSFELMTQLKNHQVLAIMAQATNKIAEGEVLQLMFVKNLHTPLETYEKMITTKTAILFGSATTLGAIVSNQTADVQTQLNQVGLKLGLAFQMMDDYLDYAGAEAKMGKNVGDDWNEGKPTFPLLYAYSQASQTDQGFLQSAILNPTIHHLEHVQSILHKTNALNFTKQKALEHVNDAKILLKNLSSRLDVALLQNFSELVVDRSC